MALIFGSQLGPYVILPLEGTGGMGEVYRARDIRLNRNVALKVLAADLAADEAALARLRREAQLLASLNHPNITAIYGVEEDGGLHALVLELVEGPTLADRLAGGALSLDEALQVALQIAAAPPRFRRRPTVGESPHTVVETRIGARMDASCSSWRTTTSSRLCGSIPARRSLLERRSLCSAYRSIRTRQCSGQSMHRRPTVSGFL